MLVHNISLRKFVNVAMPRRGFRINAKSWAQFRTRTKGWFTKGTQLPRRARNAAASPMKEAGQGWRWYRAARDTSDTLVVGEFKAAGHFAKSNAGFHRLNARPWNPAVNDAWLLGGIEGGASRIRVVSNYYDDALRVTNKYRGGPQLTTFGREIEILERAGFKFQQGRGMAKGHGWMVRQ